MSLTLEILQRHDPQAPEARGSERRFCCPLESCAGKPIDAGHRSLCVNTQTGQWTCQRCHQCGILGEFKPASEPRSYRSSLREVFAVPPPEPEKPADTAWRKELKGLVPLAGTAGADYLLRRGIPLDLAHGAGVRFAKEWYGWPAVVYPVRSRGGVLVAAAGRYVDDGKPKTRDAGQKSAGVFATPGAWEADPLLLCEGPADALSLHAAGYPAVALLGCAASDVVAWSCSMRRVAVALDADDRGDAAAAKVLAALQVRGAKAIRLRPPDGKDWNDLLREWGVERLAREVEKALVTEVELTETVAGNPVPEWTEEEKAEYDSTLGEVVAAMPDADLISWVRERFGCVLTINPSGVLRAENAGAVPRTVRDEVRKRQAFLATRLKKSLS